MKRKYFLVVSILVLAIFLSGCLGAKILSANVTIEHWYQNYNEYLGEWSDSVQVWYKIYNTGNTRISYYRVWFTAFCEYLDAGDYDFRTCFMDIGKDKRVTSVEATEWELEYWNYPVQ